MDPVKYWFDTPVNATTSISKFWFEVDERDGSQVVVHDNGGTGYVIEQDRVLFNPKRSKVSAIGTPGVNVVVAVRADKTPERVYADVMWRALLHAKDATVEFVPADEISPAAGYKFYSATIPLPRFTFDLWSVVDGVTYGEDGRNVLSVLFPQQATLQALLGERSLSELAKKQAQEGRKKSKRAYHSRRTHKF